MNEVIVTFVGICTHIRDIRLVPPLDALVPPDPLLRRCSRTVLVDASLGRRVGDEEIPPHDAILRIPNEFVESAPEEMPGLERVDLDPEAMTWKMKGVRLYLTNAEAQVTRTSSYDDLPSLTDRAGRISLDLDERVVLEGRAAAVFDLFAGELDAYHSDEAYDAVIGTARVSVPDDSGRELVIVRVRDERQSRIRLKDHYSGGLGLSPCVYLLNTGADSDKELDFLLHYDVTTWSPPAGTEIDLGDLSGIRSATPEDPPLPGDLSGLSIGCSNSNWP